MQQEIVSELTFGLKSDNAMLSESIICGEKAELSEALSLVAMAESLYVTATLESRALGKIADCRQLWVEVAELFGELCDSWTDVKSGDPSVEWLRGRLRRLLELSADRCELYSITEKERRAHAKCKESEMLEHQLQPETVREFSKLETASIDRAYRKL
jgi:hypothetical protein